MSGTSLNGNVLQCCFSFLDLGDLSRVALVSHDFSQLTKRPAIWRSVAHTFHLDQRFWKEYSKESAQQNLALIRRVNALFWGFYHRDSNYKTFMDQTIRSWKRALDPACEQLPAREQFQKIRSLISKESSDRAASLVTLNPPKPILELLGTCGTQVDHEFGKAVVHGMNRHYKIKERFLAPECTDTCLYLLENNLFPASLDFLWDFAAEFPLERAVDLMKMILSHKNFTAPKDLLHQAVCSRTWKEPVPVEILALLHEKTGVLPLPAKEAEDALLDVGVRRYTTEESAFNFIALMLRLGAIPTCKTLYEFLTSNMPRHPLFDKKVPSLECVMKCVDLLLASGVKLENSDHSSSCLNEAFCSGSEELVAKLYKAGARPDNNSGWTTFIDLMCRKSSLEMANLLLKYGAKPNLGTWLILQNHYKGEPSTLEKFKQLLFPNGPPADDHKQA